MATSSSHTPVFMNCHGYWLRCGVAIQQCLKAACLDVLLDPNVCGLPNDEKKLYAILIVFKQNESKKLKHVIKQHQWEILSHVCDKNCPAPCPKKDKTSIGELDITLICILIRNMEKIVAGFRVSLLTPFLPYIKGALEVRNYTMHCNPSSLGTYPQFYDVWLKIEKNLNGLKYQFMNRFYSLETSPLEPYTTQKLDWLNSCYQNLSSTKCDKTVVTKLGAFVTEINKCMQELSLTKCDKTEMKRFEAMVNETNSSYGELKTDMKIIEAKLQDLEQNELTRLEAMVSETNSSHGELKADMKRIEAMVSETDSSHGELKTDMKRIEAKLEDLEQNELTRLEAMVSETNNSHEELKADMKIIEAVVSETDRSHGKLKTDLKRLEAMANETKIELRTEMTKREAKVKDVQQNEPKGAELKEKYQKQYSQIKVAFSPNTSSLVCNEAIGRDEIIVDLSIVSRTSSVFDTACDKQQIKRLREQQKEICSDTASTTNYSEIVTSKDDYVIISGIPGSGKTTLVQTILYKWALGELWHEFDYVFVIYLRDLVRFKKQTGITANKMFTYYYPSYDISELSKSGKAILILEGFDELQGKTDLRSKEEEYTCYTRSIHDLFDPQNPSLPFTRLVTSRPGSCPILLETVLSDNIDLKLFIVKGFSEESIHRYVGNHFREKDQTDVVIDKLKNVPVVYDSMVVPFNCWGVCYLIKNEIPVEEFGQTETSLYANLLTLFIRKHGLRNPKIKLKDVHAHPKFKEICVGLAALAFHLEQTNKINFSEEDLPDGISIKTLVEDSGMIIKIDGDEHTYYQFLHYTFHEFFVALHMMSIGTYFLDPNDHNEFPSNFDKVKAMLAGLLGGLAVGSKSNHTLKRISKLFNTFKTESLKIENVISYTQCGSLFFVKMLTLIYEFHNPITSDIYVSDLFISSMEYVGYTRTHIEYFKKLCADKNIHFLIDELTATNKSSVTILSAILRCSECKVLSFFGFNEEWCKIFEEHYVEKIVFTDIDRPITESTLSACLQQHSGELKLIINNLESFDSVIKSFTVLSSSSINITVTKLVLVLGFSYEKSEINIRNILNACDLCEELVVEYMLEQIVSSDKQCRDLADRLLRERKFKVLKQFDIY